MYNDKTHYTPQYGGRLPAVYMHAGSNRLHICNYVNGNKDHCHGTSDVGTDWFNLKIGEREEDDVVHYEIFINGNLEYSIVNRTPFVGKKYVKLLADFANPMPETSKGRFRNLQLSTTRPERQVEPITDYIYNLIDKYDDIIYSSNLRLRQKDRLARNFDFQTEYYVVEYEDLSDVDFKPCTFPETYEDDGKADKTDPCEAIDQIVDRASKWGRVFLRNCRREANGKSPWNMYDRTVRKVNRQANKAKELLRC